MDIDLINFTPYYDVGEMNVECQQCLALYFPKENHRCCKNGDLMQQLYPIYLSNERSIKSCSNILNLFNGDHPNSRIFLNNIRSLNSIFSFTSLGISQNLTRNKAILSNSSLGSIFFFKYDY